MQIKHIASILGHCWRPDFDQLFWGKAWPSYRSSYSLC
jgi:hypothetical protein